MSRQTARKEMNSSTLYAQIESAKTKDELYAAIDRMSQLTERECGTLAELVAQRIKEFSSSSSESDSPSSNIDALHFLAAHYMAAGEYGSAYNLLRHPRESTVEQDIALSAIAAALSRPQSRGGIGEGRGRMNMRSDLVTREAVDAALAAIQEYAHNPSERAKVEIALAAALPVLLGEPVAFVDPSDLLELKRGGCGGITCGTYSKRYGRESPLYAIPTQDITLPTQDTPNADQ